MIPYNFIKEWRLLWMWETSAETQRGGKQSYRFPALHTNCSTPYRAALSRSICNNVSQSTLFTRDDFLHLSVLWIGSRRVGKKHLLSSNLKRDTNGLICTCVSYCLSIYSWFSTVVLGGRAETIGYQLLRVKWGLWHKCGISFTRIPPHHEKDLTRNLTLIWRALNIQISFSASP